MKTSLAVPVSASDHSQGSADAPVTLVEYGDYQCSYCRQAAPVVKELQRSFGDNLRYVFRNMPLTQAHPMAQSAAECAESAGAQGKFWPMHDMLYLRQPELGPALYTRLARELGLKMPQFTQDMSSHKFASRIHDDFMSGVESGAGGTPTFYINGTRYDGQVDVPGLSQAIKQAGSAS